MNSRNIFWGFALILIGIIYLLRQLGFISFHIDWTLIWSLWPAFLIIAGLKLILPASNRISGALISSLLLIVFIYVLYDGFNRRFQDDGPGTAGNSPSGTFSNPGGQPDDPGKDGQAVPDSADTDSEQRVSHTVYQQQFKIQENKGIKTASFYLDGAGAQFKADVTHDNLFEVAIHTHQGAYRMERSASGATENIRLISDQKYNEPHNDDRDPNRILFRLNPDPEWSLNFNVAAGQINYDFTGYKIKNLKFNSGVASVDLKLGNLVPLTTVNIIAGLAAFRISIPAGTGCLVSFDGTFSKKELPGFTRVDEHSWQNNGYATAAKKINLTCAGTHSSISVNTY